MRCAVTRRAPATYRCARPWPRRSRPSVAARSHKLGWAASRTDDESPEDGAVRIDSEAKPRAPAGGGRRVRQAAPGGEAVRARLGGACVAVAQRHRYAFVPGTRWLRQQHPPPAPAHVRRQTRRTGPRRRGRRRCRGLSPVAAPPGPGVDQLAPVRPPRPSPSPAPVRSPASTAAGLSVQDPRDWAECREAGLLEQWARVVT